MSPQPHKKKQCQAQSLQVNFQKIQKGSDLVIWLKTHSTRDLFYLTLTPGVQISFFYSLVSSYFVEKKVKDKTLQPMEEEMLRNSFFTSNSLFADSMKTSSVLQDALGNTVLGWVL